MATGCDVTKGSRDPEGDSLGCATAISDQKCPWVALLDVSVYMKFIPPPPKETDYDYTPPPPLPAPPKETGYDYTPPHPPK